jgi:hypothetical protein
VFRPLAAFRAQIAVIQIAVFFVACAKIPGIQHLDKDKIEINTNAEIITDSIGQGKYETTATYVLVDATNRTGREAFITLAGSMSDASGALIGPLRPESLRMGDGESRTFALIDDKNLPRPNAKAVSVVVKSVIVPEPAAPVRISNQTSFDDYGKMVIRATVSNDAKISGSIIVIASFYDANHRPMRRPFSLLTMGGNVEREVQFVGPPGSTTATLFLGDIVY